MALSDLVVRQAKATGKAYTLPDIDGLSLAVSPAGNKSWHFRYYWLGKQQRMSLGNYPEVSLRDARSLRDEARALVAKDINPHRHRKQKRAAAKLAGKHTFDAIYKKWLAHRELSLKKGRQTTLSILPRVFAKDVLPALGKRSIYDIKRPDLLEVIAKIEKRKALSVAEKVRTWFNQLFRYALVIVPDLEQNPASDLDVVALPLPPVNHNPFLRMADLPKLLQRLRKYRGVLLSAGAGLACAAPGAAGTCCATSPCSFSTCTWPANGAGRSAASQISAGESLRNVKLCDQPASLATVAFQIALPSGVGKAMPWSCSTLNTAVLLAGMPSVPCCSRCARSLSETVLLTSQRASWVSHPSEAWGWFSLNSSRSRKRRPSSSLRCRACLGAASALLGSPPSSWATEAWSARTTSSPSVPACSYCPASTYRSAAQRSG